MNELVTAEPVHYEGGELVFITPVGVVAGYVEPIQLALADGTTRDLKVKVKTSRSLGDGRFLGVGTVMEGMHPNDSLPRAVAGDEAALRHAPRIPYKTRVLGEDLPNYQAVTLDCSLSGLQLSTEGPLPVGDVLDLNLDLKENGAPVRCSARVAWCRHHPADGKYRAGLEFVEPAVDLELALKKVFSGEAEASTQAHLSHTGSPRAGEKRSPLEGLINSCILDNRTLKVDVRLAQGGSRLVQIPFTRGFRDMRDQFGSEVAELGISESPGASRYRFFSPKMEVVVEVEAAPGVQDAPPSRKISL